MGVPISGREGECAIWELAWRHGRRNEDRGGPRLWSTRTLWPGGWVGGVGVVPTVGGFLSLISFPLLLNGFPVRRVVWPRRPPHRSRRAGGLVFPGRPCPGHAVGFGIVNRQTCMLLSSGSGLDEDDPRRSWLASDHVGRCGDGGQERAQCRWGTAQTVAGSWKSA